MNQIYRSPGFRSVRTGSHRSAAGMFALARARSEFGRRGQVASLAAGAESRDGKTVEWSAYIGRPARGNPNATEGFNTNFTTYCQ